MLGLAAVNPAPALGPGGGVVVAREGAVQISKGQWGAVGRGGTGSTSLTYQSTLYNLVSAS